MQEELVLSQIVAGDRLWELLEVCIALEQKIRSGLDYFLYVDSRGSGYRVRDARRFSCDKSLA